MGLLGYYDSWLALALLAVAFSRHRWVVLLACLLAPWIDERFVIGFPLALCVRRVIPQDAGLPRWQWLRREALWPTVLVVIYGLVRLKLGGSGGSQTAAQYLHDFVFSSTLTLGERAFGIWHGLRLGWVLVALALLGTVRLAAAGMKLEAVLLVVGTLATALLGAWTALDTSRSMVLLMPLVPLGWLLAARLTWWRRVHTPTLLAAAALFLPAWHCLGNHFQPVDNLWSGAWPEATAHNNLGSHLTTLGRPDAALTHYMAAVQLKPDYPEAHNNLAIALAGTPGGQGQALAHYTEALRLNSDYPEAHCNLANLLAATPGRQDEAIAHYGQALRLKPDFVGAHINLAVLFANTGRFNEALTHYMAALRLRPEHAEARNNLAVLLAHIGRPGEALTHYAEALKWRPEYPEAHYNLAILLAKMPDQQAEALEHFAEAARLLPNHPRAHFSYARQLEKTADRQSEAEQHYARAVSLDPNFAEARTGLERVRQRP